MLVLSRYRDESIHIGNDIVITVVDVRGDRVRLGIQAPPNVSVHRREVYDAIARDKKEKGAEKTKQPEESAAPLGKKLAGQRGRPLPVDITHPPVGFGGISDVVPDTGQGGGRIEIPLGD